MYVRAPAGLAVGCLAGCTVLRHAATSCPTVEPMTTTPACLGACAPATPRPHVLAQDPLAVSDIRGASAATSQPQARARQRLRPGEGAGPLGVSDIAGTEPGYRSRYW